MRNALRGLATIAVVILAVYILAPNAVIQQATATHQPADKVAVSASVLEVFQAQAGPGAPSPATVELLRGRLKTSSPTDLIIQVTAECALWTDIKVSSGGDSTAKAGVTMWVEIAAPGAASGTVVPVTSDSNGDGVFNDPDNGEVVFCNREFRAKITLLDDADALFELFLRTRAANAFNWTSLNLGSATHDIIVKGRLDVFVSGSGDAKAAVGKRTLTVEPAKLKNDASI